MRLKNGTISILLSVLFNTQPGVSVTDYSDLLGSIIDGVADAHGQRSPSVSPSKTRSINPSAKPSTTHSLEPSHVQSTNPSSSPSDDTSSKPSLRPSSIPSIHPTLMPSKSPSVSPTDIPTSTPSMLPSIIPSMAPSKIPSSIPSSISSSIPSLGHTSNPSTTYSSNPSLITSPPTNKSNAAELEPQTPKSDNGGTEVAGAGGGGVTTILLASFGSAIIVGGAFFMAVKYMMRHNQPDSRLGDILSHNSGTIESERTSVWKKRISEDVKSDFGSKDDAQEAYDIRSVEGSYCHEHSVFNGSTIKSEGSWIQRAKTFDIYTKKTIDILADLEKDKITPIPGQIVVSESKES